MLKAGVVGLGRMGSGFDDPADAHVRTHLKASLTDQRIRLVMVADADMQKARREVARFGIDAEVTSPEVLLDAGLDVVAIATPDEHHIGQAERAVAGGCRAVIIEKPVGGDRARRDALLAQAAGRTFVTVNYPRRFMPGVADWLTQARNGKFQKPVTARIRYNRGLRHNAIHGFDLISACMLGAVRSAVAKGSAFEDYSLDDRTISGVAELAVGDLCVPLFLEGVDGRQQTAFEVDLTFEAGRLQIIDCGGVRARFFEPEMVALGFAPELRLIREVEDCSPSPVSRLWHGVVDILSGDCAMAAQYSDAMRADGLLDDVMHALQSVLTAGC